MRRFASFYIFLFLIDAGHSLVDEILTLAGSPLPWLSGVRLLIAYLVIAASAVMYLCLGLDRRLPKRIFLPLTLYIAWCSLALWPLSGVIDRALLPLVASVGQVALGLLTLVLLRGWVVLPQKMFQRAAFSLRNTLGFVAINLLLAPAVLLFGALAMAGNYLEEHTAGFLRISPTGIYMAERSYHRAGQEVRLAGMMHVGKKEYYRDLAASLPAVSTVILTEGVTDQDRLLEHDFDYGKLARVIGVNSQDQMQIDGNRVDLNAPARSAAGAGDKPDLAWADIDLNRFDPQTVEFLNVIGKTLFSGRPLNEALTDYSDWAAENMSPERVATVMSDILDKRNQAVIASMAKALPRYETIIVPWGALHMPAIEDAVLDQGFAPGAKKERMSLDFRAVPYRELWRKFSTRAATASTTPPQSGLD